MIRSAQEFVALRSSANPDEYRRAAQEPAALDVWLKVLDDYPTFRMWVAHNKTIPEEVIRLLAEDADPDVRWAIALKRKTPVDVLEALSGDENELVRARVASHPKAPLLLLERLARDPADTVSATAGERIAALRAGRQEPSSPA